jgi:ssDNA-binding Zn-finger/Zn-ribbon topoisomerase 1
MKDSKGHIMSVIRPLKPQEERHVCPDCSAPEGLFIDADRKLTCKLCSWKDSNPVGNASNYTIPNDTGSLKQASEDLRDVRTFKITHYITNRSEISNWGLAAYDTAISHIQREEWGDGIKALERAIDSDRDFIEAHLWLGRLLIDEDKQRDHLSHVIALQPQHAEAQLELMYLNGQVALSQLEHALFGDGEVTIQEATAPVKSETTILSCPICGGHMTTHPITGHVECAFCGHIDETDTTDASTTGGSLVTALLQQRSEGTKWIIGEHILSCNTCGAETTIPKGRMGSNCMFCGSNHIIEKDALNSFRQPEGIIPFSIPQEQAEQAVQDKLLGKWERFKGVFVNNKVTRSMFAGTYLPFWVFDIILDVHLSFRLSDTSASRYGAKATRRETRADVFNNYPFPAVVSPSPRLIDKITRYDFTKVQGYDPSALARYPAEIYQIDFDKASLEAQGRVRRMIREQHQNQLVSIQTEEITSVSAMVRNMSFRLLLLPVWIATLIEDDGDVRIGLVNGQTGQAVLGKARQPEKFS